MNPTVLLSKEWVRYVLILLVGITVGAVFYPTKKIEEKTSLRYEQQITSLKEQQSKEISTLNQAVDQAKQETQSVKEDSDKKISSLRSQISELKSKTTTIHYKVIKPDGTVVERDSTQSDVDNTSDTVTQVQQEYKQQLDAIDQKWSTMHEQVIAQMTKDFSAKESEYQSTIESLQKSKTVTVNEKHFSVEGGMMNDKDYYVHATADLWGPVFLGLQGEIRSTNSDQSADNRLGMGIGIRF